MDNIFDEFLMELFGKNKVSKGELLLALYTYYNKYHELLEK